MSSNGCRGFTLIEMIIAMVIISVGLAGVLSAFNAVVKSSADPLIQKQMLALAEEMMEEVLLKPYLAGSGSISGCNRSAADDVSDYAGYNQGVCTIDGQAITALAGYAVAVTLAPGAGDMAAGGHSQQITVTVTHGTDSVSLTGWRVDYANGLGS